MSAIVTIHNVLGKQLTDRIEIPRLATVAQLKERIKPVLQLGTFCRLQLGTRELADFQRFSGKEFDYPVALTLDVALDCDNSYSVWAWGNPDFGGCIDELRGLLREGVVSICCNSSAFAAVKKGGTVVAWGDATAGGDTSTCPVDNAVAICSNKTVFAALRRDGSVVAWGDPDNGGDTTKVADKLSSGAIEICSNDYAFAVLRNDGSIVAWGSPANGGDLGDAAPRLASGIKAIYNSHMAFVALTDLGGVVAWGHPDYGGRTDAVAEDLTSDVIGIYSNEYAFAALKEGGRVVVWGNRCGGGEVSEEVAEQLKSGVIAIFRNEGAFVALKAGGVAIAWGDGESGGDASSVSSELQSNIVSVRSTDSAFAALKRDGSVVCWGNADRGGHADVVQKLKFITQIYSTEGAFAAVNYRGAVVAWGDSESGGDCSEVAEHLKKGITDIYTNGTAFAALNRKKGKLVTWGNPDSGGDSSKVLSQLESGIVNVCSNRFAFVALKESGEIVTWGSPYYGGNSIPGIPQVTSIHCSEGAMVALSSVCGPEQPGMLPLISSLWSEASNDNSRFSSGASSGNSSTEEAVAELLQATAPFEDCELERCVGDGSFGKVWYGSWGGSSVAVKVIKSTEEGKIGLEGALAEKLSHPNIIQTYKYSTREVKSEQGDGYQQSEKTSMLETWIVMEWCNLGPLSQHLAPRKVVHEKGEVDTPQILCIRENGEVDMFDVLRILREVGGATNYLHCRGVVHGDLSANNVLLCERRHGFTCKVCDFGLACCGMTGTLKKQGLGSITHMAPELLESGELTPKVDVYSWGVLMYHVKLRSPAPMVEAGKRLELPSNTSSEYNTIFLRATEARAEARPDLEVLTKELSRVSSS